MESRVILVGLAWVTAFRMVWLYALTKEEDLRKNQRGALMAFLK